MAYYILFHRESSFMNYVRYPIPYSLINTAIRVVVVDLVPVALLVSFLIVAVLASGWDRRSDVNLVDR